MFVELCCIPTLRLITCCGIYAGIAAAGLEGMAAADVEGIGSADVDGIGSADVEGIAAADVEGMGAADVEGIGSADVTILYEYPIPLADPNVDVVPDAVDVLLRLGTLMFFRICLIAASSTASSCKLSAAAVDGPAALDCITLAISLITCW